MAGLEGRKTMSYYEQKNERWKHKALNGSVTLEAAIVTPVLIITLLVMILTIYARSAMFCWQAAANKMAQEQKLAFVLASSAVNLTGLNEAANRQLNEIPAVWRSQVVNLGTTIMTGRYLGGQVNKWFDRTTGGSRLLGKLIRNRKFYVEKDAENNVLWLNSYYSIPLGLGTIKGQAHTPIPLWTGIDNLNEEEDESKSDDNSKNFWDWHNFKRGAYLREQNGGNLPHNYPVISRFKSGEATMIKSIDLTAPTWQNPDNITEQASRMVKNLAGFNGTSELWGKDRISIRNGDIKSRKIIIVVPENSPPQALAALRNALAAGAGQGVFYEIIQSEISRKYTKPKV